MAGTAGMPSFQRHSRGQTASFHDVVRQIGEQNSKDDVELKQPHEPASPFSGRDLRYVHRAEHR